MRKISKKGNSFEIIRLVVLLSALGLAVFFAFKILSFLRFDWSFLAEWFPKEERERVLPIGAEEFPFTDLFSGVGHIDEQKTTAWHDRKTESFFLPPKYEWKELEGESFSASQSGSLGLTAFVQQIENDQFGREQYKGTIYGVEGGEIISNYPGEFSFGGTLDNWLAIYGAYEGKALRGSGNQAVEDYSKFFGIRVMEEKGFRAQIISKDDAWFIGAGAPPAGGLPKFLRIQSNTANDLTSALGLDKYEYNLLGESKDENTILVKAITKNDTKIFSFKNLGFDQSINRVVYSNSIRTLPENKRIFAAVIKSVQGNLIEEGIDFYFSSDSGASWKKAEVGKEVFFDKGRDLKWRAVLKKQRNAFETPSLSQIEMRYYVVPADS